MTEDPQPQSLQPGDLSLQLHEQEEDHHHRATISIPINSLWLDAPGILWQWAKELTALLFIILVGEPFIDATSLIDLSIALLVLERVGAQLQPFEPRILLNNDDHKVVIQILATRQQQQFGAGGDDTATTTIWIGNLLFGSPTIIALFGTLALIFSCMANASYDSQTQFLAPIWLRTMLPQHRRRGQQHDGQTSSSMSSDTLSTVMCFIMVILFCLESILLIFILLLAFHALTFPQYIEEDIAIFFLLTGIWIFSLVGSGVVRYYLYYSLGD